VPAYLTIDSGSVTETAVSQVEVRITATSQINNFETITDTGDFFLIFYCDPILSVVPGPILIEYLVTHPLITYEYLLSAQRPCQLGETRFEISLPAESGLIFTFTAQAASLGASILTIQSDELLLLSGTQMELELTEINNMDET
jgi:hypothetical protein